MITFSVITCTYNAAGTLAGTLASVRGQTYGGVEHIVVDGASTDGTLAMLRDYHAACPAAVVVSERDEGLYYAMNKGLALATGQYVVFLNAGDTFHSPDTLARLAALAADGAPAVLYGNTDIVDAAGRFLRVRRLQPPETLTWRSFKQGMLVCHQAFYARTDIARCTQYDTRYRFSADVDWCIRVMREAERLQAPLLNTHLTLCNYLDEGLTTRNHRASLLERFRVMTRHYGLLSTTAHHFAFLLRQNFVNTK